MSSNFKKRMELDFLAAHVISSRDYDVNVDASTGYVLTALSTGQARWREVPPAFQTLVLPDISFSTIRAANYSSFGTIELRVSEPLTLDVVSTFNRITIGGDFSQYISTASLASTVAGISDNFYISSLTTSTINYANFYTSTVYLGDDNLSTNVLRFRGTYGDGAPPQTPYTHTVIGERIYQADESSELLLFKGNDITSDRIRYFAPRHQFDVTYNAYITWPEGQDPPAAQIPAAVYIDASSSLIGLVGINNASPSYPLDVSGDLHITGDAYKPGGGSWSAPSDERIKTNIQPIDIAACLSSIRALPMKSYSYSADYRAHIGNIPEKHYKGFIAQEVEQVIPDAVQRRSDYIYDDFRTLDYHPIHMNMYGAIQELAKVQEAQQSTILGQAEEIADMRTIIGQILKH